MIIKLKEGESLAFICKISGLTLKDIETENGFLPEEGQYFYLPRENVCIVKEQDTLFSLAKKTKLSPEEIMKRTRIEVGKKFYF